MIRLLRWLIKKNKPYKKKIHWLNRDKNTYLGI